MTRIVIDDVLREKLKGMTESLEIVDECGKPCALVTLLPRRLAMGQAECPPAPRGDRPTAARDGPPPHDGGGASEAGDPLMYRLDFDPPAYLELKAIHDEGDGLVRHEIAAALDALDAQLRPAPNDVGESRECANPDRVAIPLPVLG